MGLFEKISSEPSKAVTVNFPVSFLEELDLRARAMGVSRSAYLRIASRYYFRKEDNERK